MLSRLPLPRPTREPETKAPYRTLEWECLMPPRRKRVTEFSDNGNSQSDRWHINRGIPVIWLIGSLVIGIAQFGGLVWYAAQFSARVDSVERTVPLIAQQGERLTRLEEKVVSVQATANRIEALLTPVKTR
jgi:hypothetical protein